MAENTEKKTTDEQPEKKGVENPNPALYGRCYYCGAALHPKDGGDDVFCPEGCLM